MATTTIADAIAALERFAPLSLAGDWDNVGLLLEPTPVGETALERILLCIDLTPPVMEEALSLGAGLVIAYHPPIFSGLKRLVRDNPRSNSLLNLIRAGTSVFSPHTALDAARGGVNDWLVEGLPDGIAAILEPTGGDPAAATGQGRLVTLHEPATLKDLATGIRRHLGTNALRVACGHPDPNAHRIHSIALCPGAGGSVIGGSSADLLWTGEMRHHDVLAAVERGQTVLLAEHTHTERGYLPRVAELLRRELSVLPPDQIRVSTADRDPLQPCGDILPRS